MQKKTTSFFIAFTLCTLSLVTLAGLNKTALESEITSSPGLMFDLDQRPDGIHIFFFDSSWVADRAHVERLQRLGERFLENRLALLPPGPQALRAALALGRQRLADLLPPEAWVDPDN
ncbi:MAG: hypothetical protein GXX99_08150 [Clostridiales bacterium]|nr:hypothetical protein [Clostridiales bacterium]